ncbi:muscular LMNA-interacting protein isoform 25-T30 [Hipposideros larvatus]
MEFEKHGKGSLLSENLEEKLTSNFNKYLTLNTGSQQERGRATLAYPSEVSGNISQGRGFKANKPQGMQQGDLFKAEYVFIVDSEGEDEATSRKSEQSPPRGISTTATRPKSLPISSSLVSDVVRPKTRGANLQAPFYPEIPHGMAPQQKHGQLTSSSTTSEQLACKPPAFSFVSPTNPKTPPGPANLDGASVLEEFHTRRLDVGGALVEESATYFQTSAHSSPFSAPKGTFSTLQFPYSTQLPGPKLSSPSAAEQKPGLTSEVLKNTASLTSRVPTPGESLRTSSPSRSSGASLKSNPASYIPALQLSPSALHPHGGGTLPSRLGRSESSGSDHRSSVSTPSPHISLTRTKELISPCALSMPTGLENKTPKQYKTKSSYKAFAAIPTNIFLLEQKALDEPAKSESVSKDNTLDPPLELYNPAQLRQQTEELCATIDKVLQESLSMHSSNSSRSLQTLLSSDTVKTPTTVPRAAGRETKYANLSSPSSTVSESQLTKPGVIRPVPVKSKILLKKEEEVCEPNPFSKYLEDNSDFFSEQDVTAPHKPVSLHPLYQTKLYPPAKSLLHPQTLSQTDCLTPGPFTHLSSFSLTDEQENSHTLFSHNAYNKLSHPMVAIPEHETLDSKEQ